jgi:hypothetical protein
MAAPSSRPGACLTTDEDDHPIPESPVHARSGPHVPDSAAVRDLGADGISDTVHPRSGFRLPSSPGRRRDVASAARRSSPERHRVPAVDCNPCLPSAASPCGANRFHRPWPRRARKKLTRNGVQKEMRESYLKSRRSAPSNATPGEPSASERREARSRAPPHRSVSLGRRLPMSWCARVQPRQLGCV